MPVLTFFDVALTGKEFPDEMKLHCDSCGEVIPDGQKYWLITSVGKDFEEENVDFTMAVCLECAPQGFQMTVEVNEDD